MTSPREQTRAPLANSEAKKRKRGAGGGSERRRLGKLPWRSRPCKETPRRGCPVRTELRDERREGRGATRGSPASPPAEALGQDSHSAWRGSSASPRPPRWRPARSRRASSPTKRVAPPGGVTFSSRPGSGSCCSPSACGHPPLRPGRRCPGSRRLQVWHRGAAGPGGHAGSVRPGRLPSGLPRSLPARAATAAAALRLARPLSPPPGGSGGNWRSRGGAGVCPAGGDGAGTPEPAVSALGRDRRRPFAALRLRGARRWRRLWAQEAEAGPGREGREGRGGETRGEARGEGLRARGRGSGRRGGGCSRAGEAGRAGAPPPSPERGRRPGAALGHFSGALKLRVASEGGGAGGGGPARPHPGSATWNGFLSFCPYLSLPLLLLSPRSL